jgi:hypothetical protein
MAGNMAAPGAAAMDGEAGQAEYWIERHGGDLRVWLRPAGDEQATWQLAFIVCVGRPPLRRRRAGRPRQAAQHPADPSPGLA